MPRALLLDPGGTVFRCGSELLGLLGEQRPAARGALAAGMIALQLDLTAPAGAFARARTALHLPVRRAARPSQPFRRECRSSERAGRRR